MKIELSILILLLVFMLIKDSRGQDHLYTTIQGKTIKIDSSQTPTIIIVYEDLEIADSIETALMNKIRYLYKFYKIQFELEFPLKFEIKLTIIGGFKKYRHRVDSIWGPGSRRNIGVYFPKLKEAFVSTVDLERTFIHEASHALLHESKTHCPAWLNEGIAEYVKNISLQKDSVATVPPDAMRVKDLGMKVQNNTELYDINKYLRLNDKEWYGEPELNEYYDLAWSLVFFMMDSNDGRILIKDLLPYKKFQRSRSSSIQLIDSFYGKAVHKDNANFKKFSMDWHMWIKSENKTKHDLDLYPVKENKTWKWMKKMHRKVG